MVHLLYFFLLQKPTKVHHHHHNTKKHGDTDTHNTGHDSKHRHKHHDRKQKPAAEHTTDGSSQESWQQNGPRGAQNSAHPVGGMWTHTSPLDRAQADNKR